jgi:hypothetical protein
MVIVRVGESDQTRTFAVYEKLIRNSSVFMNNALKQPWKESTNRIVCLPGFQPATFDVYHLWLLTGKLHCRRNSVNDSQTTSTAISRSDLSAEMNTLQQLSHLGHFLVDFSFTDTVCDAILQCSKDLQLAKIGIPITFGV